MKHVEAIIRLEKYYETKEALVAHGFYSTTTLNCLGRGKESSEYLLNTGDTSPAYGMEFVAKKYLSIYVRDESVDELVDTILSVNKNGTSGDGKIFISDVGTVLRIRTGETNDEAIM